MSTINQPQAPVAKKSLYERAQAATAKKNAAAKSAAKAKATSKKSTVPAANVTPKPTTRLAAAKEAVTAFVKKNDIFFLALLATGAGALITLVVFCITSLFAIHRTLWTAFFILNMVGVIVIPTFTYYALDDWREHDATVASPQEKAGVQLRHYIPVVLSLVWVLTAPRLGQEVILRALTATSPTQGILTILGYSLVATIIGGVLANQLTPPRVTSFRYGQYLFYLLALFALIGALAASDAINVYYNTVTKDEPMSVAAVNHQVTVGLANLVKTLITKLGALFTQMTQSNSTLPAADPRAWVSNVEDTAPVVQDNGWLPS